MLAEVNRAGAAKPSAIAHSLKIPRPTVYRLLGMLTELGYVRHNDDNGTYQVTLTARRLGEGYRSDLRLSEIAAPVLEKLGSELVWPIDLSVYRDGSMVVQETTHPTSPFSIDRTVSGRQLPMLQTAAGRAYLAFCAPRIRDAILTQLTGSGELEREAGSDHLATTLAETRKRGYGLRIGETYIPQTSSIAMPIMHGDEVEGCIAVIWITRAVGATEAIRQFEPPLKEAVSKLERLVAREPY